MTLPALHAMQSVAPLTVALGDRYHIERELGRGGMATVYRARDLKHDRVVALKVLDPELGAVLGAERFLTEIRVTANLQHPNLLPLFDSGEAAGLLYYVMPYIEGETLRHRLNREKQLPVDDAVRIAVAVADALDYAHGHGIIHRDLKPENILLQHGQPVVADFGIALAVSNAGGTRVTQTGLSLGTPQYMSPEQATGDRVIDGRTDVYSLAAVTYEMLVGEPPHSGPTAQAIIAKLMTSEPQSLRMLRPSVPVHAELAVLAGLAKLPADRLPSARAFADALTDRPGTLGAMLAGAQPVGAGADRSRRVLITRITTAAALALVSIAAVWGWARPTPVAPVIRYELTTDSASRLSDVGRYGRIALSPDGATLVYVGGPRHSLFVRRRDELRAIPLPGTDDAFSPFFSPDGKRVGFLSHASPSGRANEGVQLMVVPLAGGDPVMITDSLVGVFGATWAADDYIYTDGFGATPLVRVAARAGARPSFFNVLDSTLRENDAVDPFALPDNRGILFEAQQGKPGKPMTWSIIVSEGTGPSARSHVVVEDAWHPVYVHPGRLLYTSLDGKLMMVPFDLRTLRVSGGPTMLGDGLAENGRDIDFTASAGRLVYILAAGGSRGELVWLDRRGRESRVDSTWRLPFADPVLSPDDNQIAVSTRTFIMSSADVWIKRLDDGSTRKLTIEGGNNAGPTWTADGKRVLYAAAAASGWQVLERPADGSGTPVVRARSRQPIPSVTVTPDDRWVVFDAGVGGNLRIYAQRAGDTAAVRLIPGETPQTHPVLSDDGRWLAYIGIDGTSHALFVVPFPNVTAGKWLVSRAAAAQPAWSHDGTELFYCELDSLVAVPVSTRGAFSFGKPHALIPTTDYSIRTREFGRFDVSRDGSKFLFVRSGSSGLGEKLIDVEGWRP